jgi:hypothetical protein
MKTVLDADTCQSYAHKGHGFYSSPPTGKLRLHKLLSDAQLMLRSCRELEFFYSRGMENGCHVKMRRQLGLMEAVVPRCGKNKNVALYGRRAFILSFLR